jgi:hypothetical protein
MLCDKYKETLIESAASGAALPNPVREHVDTCAHCRTTLATQEALVTSVDAGLRSRASARVPSNFDHRVRAALQGQTSLERRLHSSLFAFGSVAAAAAVVMGVFLTPSPHRSRKEGPPKSVVQSKSSTPEQDSPAAASRTRMPTSPAALYSRTSALKISPLPNALAPGNDQPEVLVPQGQEELLVKYMEGVAARRAQAAFSASLQHEADMKPMEVPSTEISELIVKPLPDLSSN